MIRATVTAGAPLGILGLAISVFLAGCEVFGPDVWEERQAHLERHRDAWEAHGISDYRFELLKSGEMFTGISDEAFHLAVVVAADTVQSATFVMSGTPLTEELYPLLSTVDGLFESVAAAIEQRADGFNVEYDPALGYPTSISVDYSRDHLDDEYSVLASDLEPLQE